MDQSRLTPTGVGVGVGAGSGVGVGLGDGAGSTGGDGTGSLMRFEPLSHVAGVRVLPTRSPVIQNSRSISSMRHHTCKRPMPCAWVKGLPEDRNRRMELGP